jgi:chloride channel 3/4/5
MATKVVSLPATGLDIRALERIMSENQYQGYPIVEDASSKTLLGYIGRTELKYALDRAKRDQMAPPHARCFFSAPDGGSEGRIASLTTPPAVSFDTMSATATQLSIDLSRFIDPTPLSVHPRLPLETVMELFKKMGPRVILIEHRGRLAGLVTVKDCLKYQFKVEALEHPQSAGGGNETQEKLWSVIRRTAGWVDAGLGRLRRGMGMSGQDIRLLSPVMGRETERERERDGFAGGDGAAEVELEDRGRSGVR